MTTVAYHAIAPDGDALALVDGALPVVESGWRLREALDALVPLVGRPCLLRLAADVDDGPDRRLRLLVFDTGGAASDADVPGPLRPAFDRWLAEQRGAAPVPALRPAWARPGWHAEVEAWAGEPLEQLRLWPLSAVLRGDGVVVKAAFPLFRAEPAITRALAREHPGAVPDVLAIDETRGLLSMRELASTGCKAADAAPALRTLAELQRAWAGRTADLLALGAQDRRQPDAPRSPLPDTLVHGDFHAGNVALEDGRAVLFDWSDACVAQPLYDLHLFLTTLGDGVDRDPLVAAYAEGWDGVAGADEIAAALDDAAYHSCLHQVESYRAIAAGCEPDDRPQFVEAERFWRNEATNARRAGTPTSPDTPR